MIDVMDDWWVAMLIAGIAGLVGGLVFELLLTRFGDAGMIERFGRVQPDTGTRKYIDLGFLASMIVGAVAALGFLYFMPPTEVLDASGKVIRREYDPFRLVPASLIVGSAGGAFLTAMQERVKRVVAQTSNANARAILEPASTDATGGLIAAGAGSPAAVSQDTVQAAVRALGG